MTRLPLLLVALLTVGSPRLAAQTVQGRLLESSGESPIAGALVQLTDSTGIVVAARPRRARAPKPRDRVRRPGALGAEGQGRRRDPTQPTLRWHVGADGRADSSLTAALLDAQWSRRY